jgi:ABC-type sulfate transport system permease component
MRNLSRTDRGALVTVVVLVGAFTLFFVLPFAGLVVRAIEEPRTWELLRTSQVRQALTLSLWTSTLTVILAVAGRPSPGGPSSMRSSTSRSCSRRRWPGWRC